MTTEQAVNLPPTVFCPECHAILPLPTIELSYFQGDHSNCPECDHSLDLWTAMFNSIRDWPFAWTICAAIGARSTFFVVIMTPNTRIVLDFEAHGVPANARIIEVQYTAQGGGLHPLEWHGNVPIRDSSSLRRTLVPVPFGDQDPQDTRVAVMVSWVPEGPDDIAWENLVRAFHAYSQRQYASAIIPANIAIEVRLVRFLTDYLTQSAGKERVEDFLDNAATHSHRLNVLLRVAANHVSAPELSETLRGHLNRLRKLRNQIAHYGRIDSELGADESAELILSAYFGFRYVELLHELLTKIEKDS